MTATARANIRDSDPVWMMESYSPAWKHAIRVCGGGYFHSPPALAATAPAGEAVFISLRRRGAISGVACGVRHACRFSTSKRHYYFPTLPALADDIDGSNALRDLIAFVQNDGGVDVHLDSFDARWTPGEVLGEDLGAPRAEYVVDLTGGRDALAAGCGSQHRRKFAKGERAGWDFTAASGAEALEVLSLVLRAASDRHADRGDSFDAAQARPEFLSGTPLDEFWGSTVFVASDRNVALSAAVVGFANHRAFYISGGSTPAGYEIGAAAWLHWRIMGALAARGFVSYNLGGAPASASAPDDPGYGLHRFKTGFGAQPVLRRGMHWELRGTHMNAHKISSWANGEVSQWLR